MSPYEIELLIHYYVSPAPHPRSEVSTIAGATQSFLTNGLIKLDETTESGYTITERGAAHIRLLCSTPWPVQQWADEYGKIIDA